MSFTHGFFSNSTTSFQFTRYELPAKFSHDNILVTRDLRKLVTPFPVELKLKNKTKEIMGPLFTLDESN